MPASLQSRWDRCHGEGAAAFWVTGLGVTGLEVAAPGVAGRAERLGWNPGPPARPCSAWVAPSARGVGFGVSGEDQDPSGSRRGEGTAMAARQGLACGQGLAGPVGAGSRGSGPTGASSPASWARMLSGAAVSGPAVSGLALWEPTVSGLAADGCGARRNHPAGGATPGQELSSSADSPAACPSAAGSGACLPGLAVRGLPVRGRLRGIVGLRLARARNHQAWRHGPGGNQIFRIIPAEQPGTLPLLLRRGTMLTIPTRLVTFCTHHRPQSRHISGKMP